MFKTLSSALEMGQQAALRLRLNATGVHLLLSALVAILAFALVHFVWYPGEYWEMAGGRELFFLVVSVDVVLGPLITLAIFNPGKGLGRLKFDLSVVAALQMVALLYGLWTVSVARPVYLVFAGDRFNLVTAVALDPADIKQAEMPEFLHLPWTGPQMIGVRPAISQEEKLELISSAIAGKDVELRPKLYRPYDAMEVASKARPIEALRLKTAGVDRTLLEAQLDAIGKPPESLRWLPVIARGDWIVLLDAATAQPLRFAPINGF